MELEDRIKQLAAQAKGVADALEHGSFDSFASIEEASRQAIHVLRLLESLASPDVPTDDLNPSMSGLFTPGGRRRLAQLICFPYPPQMLTREQIARRIDVVLARIAQKVDPKGSDPVRASLVDMLGC